MVLAKEKRRQIQTALLRQIQLNKLNINQFVAQYQLSRQTVYRYLRELQSLGIISVERSHNKCSKYALVTDTSKKTYKNRGLQEDAVWKQDVAPFFKNIPPNAFSKASYIFTELFNNAIEHSASNTITVALSKSAIYVGIIIMDNGVGIFQKIQNALQLPEKRFAILELAKGKYTTDPQNHTGEGIFFSSRIADTFAIISDELFFMSQDSDEAKDSLSNNALDLGKGTVVFAMINFDSEINMQEVFHMYTEHPDHFGFNATNVPVRLLEYGEENPVFVSRSQARRLLTRFERFNKITLDFTGVESIMQGFADELFRVFAREHPDCLIIPVNCNKDVRAMIDHVLNTK